MVPTII